MTASPYWDPDPRESVEIIETGEVPLAAVSETGYPMDELTTLFDSAFSGMFPALAAAGIQPAGPALALYRGFPGETVDIEVGVPVVAPLTGELTAGNGTVVSPSALPAGRIAAISHIGSYDALGEAWERFLEQIAERGEHPTLPFWEVYVTEPGPDVDPATMRTDLYTLLG